MKTYRIELAKVKQMANSGGLVDFKVDALVLPTKPRDDDDGSPSTVLSMSEETARVLFLLLKQQMAQIDGRKARSQR